MNRSGARDCALVLIVLWLSSFGAGAAPREGRRGDRARPSLDSALVERRPSLRQKPDLRDVEDLAPSAWRLRKPLPAPQELYDPNALVVDVAAEAALTPPGSGELDPTIDVEITQEIIDVAAQLGTARAMYEFVRDEFEFQPYHGSRKGSVETLHQRAGNDYDLASLLIALLRAAGIPARYAEGEVEMPVERVNGWLGVDDGEVAGSILFTSGLEGVSIIDGSAGSTCCSPHGTPGCDDGAIQACVCAQDAFCCNTQWDQTCVDEVTDFECGDCPLVVVAVRAQRVWVEALVSDGFGSPTWYPLDPAFKQHDVRPGLDVPEEMGLDAVAFVDEYYDPSGTATLPREETLLELLEQNVADYLAANHPGLDVAEVVRTASIVPESLGSLPHSLPYLVRSREGTFTEIPAARRYRIRFRLYDGSTTLIDHTFDLPSIAGRRVSIDYVGATPADQSIIDANGGIYETPPSQVDLKPVLRVDGVDRAVGAAGVGMGLSHGSDIHFLAPVNGGGLPQNVVPSISNTIVSGAAQVVGFSIEGVTEGLMEPPPDDDTEGLASLRQDTALDYLSRVRQADLALAGLMHAFVTTDVADAIVENVVRVTFDGFGVPQTFDWVGLRVDADRSVLGVWPVDRLDPPGGEPKDFLVISGAEGSLQESLIYEDSYGQDSVSTIKILELASDAGITIYKRWDTLPLPPNSLSASDRAALQAAIQGGHQVTFPAQPMTFGTGQTWAGTGWISMDPTDGAAGYIISGGHNGGATVEAWPPEFIDLSQDDKDITRVVIEIRTPDNDSPDADAIFTRDTEQTLVFEYVVHVTYDDGSTRTLPGGDGTYRRETRNTTRTFVPGNYDFHVWIARRVWWIFNVTIAEAERKVSIVGVLVRGPRPWWNPFACGSDAEKFLPILPPAAGIVSADLKACVYPENDPSGNPLAQGYSWSGGAQLIYTTPMAQETQIRAGAAPSAALDDQQVDVTVNLPGGKQAMGAASFNFTRGGIDPRHKMTVYRVSMEYPSAPPLTTPATGPDFFGNEFTFTAPGDEVKVRCRAMVEPNVQEVKDKVDEKLKWEIPNLTTFLGFGGWSWNNSWGFLSDAGKGHGITNALFGTESSLPSTNAGFGRKTVKLSLEVDGTLYEVASREVEFFYPRMETNHPGSPANAPNWFYYWKSGNVCGIDDQVEYDNQAGLFGFYNHGEDHINIGALAATRNTGPETYTPDAGSGYGSVTVTGIGIGPDCCAETIGHEKRHKHYYESWNGSIATDEGDGELDGDDYDDPDDDGIPNVREPGYDGMGSNPNDPDTYNMGGGYSGYGDNEVRCRNFELFHGIAVDTTRDWANPGSNSNPPYIP